MTIPRFMLLGFIVPVLLGMLLYASIASYQPPDVGLAFDAKHLSQYPFRNDDYPGHFHTESGNYVLGDLSDSINIYGLKQHHTIWEAARELGLSHRDLSEDWVGSEGCRTYRVEIQTDIATIYEIEFCRSEYLKTREWASEILGYDMATIKYREHLVNP